MLGGAEHPPAGVYDHGLFQAWVYLGSLEVCWLTKDSEHLWRLGTVARMRHLGLQLLLDLADVFLLGEELPPPPTPGPLKGGTGIALLFPGVECETTYLSLGTGVAVPLGTW